MGWTEYPAKHFHRSGQINRKAECDAYFLEGPNRGHYKIHRSVLKGSVYYAAISNMTSPAVYGVVILTSVRDKYWFGYKVITEDMGPCYYDCPASILNLLTPTTDKIAQHWRDVCNKCGGRQEELSRLPIGSVIQVCCGGVPYRLRKMAPTAQFKTPFWLNEASGKYMMKKYIGAFTVISIPSKSI